MNYELWRDWFCSDKLRKLGISATFLLLVFSCQNKENQIVTHKYFDVKGFVNQQMTALNSRKPTVEKRITLGDSVDVLTTNDIDWKAELELFLQTDLNKPSYQASYEIIRPDSNTYIYKLKPTEKLLVKNLTIVLDSVLKHPVSIKAQVQDANKLYNSEKNLTLVCDNKANIRQYEVSGYQKLVMTDAKKYVVTGKIR